MDSKLFSNNSNRYINKEQEETDVLAQENIAESPPSSTMFNMDGLVPSPTNSSLKKRRAIQKRVVQIPIKETEGSRLKGESNTPPSDSWAWRKYGQKPIKGSPYPRGYYRCSSSKGCPARKQVERSHVDPTMLVVTYSSDHNHPWPVSRNHHHSSSSSAAAKPTKKPEPEPEVVAEPEPEPEDNKFADLAGDELGWFGEMETTTSSAVLESPIMAEYDADVASVLLPMREEDESLFADLGELPECSVVFRRGMVVERRRYRAPWCGTTS
ncbi:probable WRKY transcription factor 65 isoform X2 [Gastrolobium bilobum]|uniref:probable WRKY transcription factor 65 isoform X2 n=1 Tax=Gastrolobium bilobum TaxID=150636 RepID=UPI002AB03551|nr:probable WRKY transcription factor 65 isoform X2 [Gastrolobium bilobum]